MNVEYVPSFSLGTQDFSIDNQCCTRPLFHGSTEKGINASEEEIRTMYDVSLKLRDVLVQHFKGVWHEKRVKDYLNEVHNEWFFSAIGSYGVSYYEYGDIYLTNKFGRALSYSEPSFGELGRMVAGLIQAREDLGELKNDAILNTQIARFNKLHQEYVDSTPVIVIFEHVLFDDLLCAQDGSPFLCGNDEFDREGIEMVYEGIALDFRLLHPQKYVGKAIRGEAIQELQNQLRIWRRSL